MSLENFLVRIGRVSDITDNARRLVRVEFPGMGGEVSAVMKVVGAAPVVSVEPAGGHEHGMGKDKTDGEHKHDVSVAAWMPTVGQQAVCLFIQGGGGDGFVLGGL